MGTESPGLTDKQRLFSGEFVVDRNATRAYLRAFGPVAYTTAKSEGSRLLSDPAVRAEVEAAGREHARHCGITARRVLTELARIAFSDMGLAFSSDPASGPGQMLPFGKMDPSTRRAIHSIRVKRRRLIGKDDAEWEIESIEVRMHDKLAALTMLGKHLGLLKDGVALEKLAALLDKHPAA